MPIVDLECAVLTLTTRQLCVRYPVGQEICATLPDPMNPDPSELVAQLFAQINAVLAPFNNILDIVDAILAVFECIKSIPKAILTLNPQPIFDCIQGLAQAVDRLLSLVPIFSIPLMLIDLIDALIWFLTAQRALILRMQRRIADAIAAGLRATPSNFQLGIVVDCVNANLGVQVASLNEANYPINRIIGQLNKLMCIIGLDPLIPEIGAFTLPDPTLELIDLLIETLQALRNLIPILEPPTFGPGGTCS